MDPDPDPLVRGTDPGIRIRIRTKMSRIPKTALQLRPNNPGYVLGLKQNAFSIFANKISPKIALFAKISTWV